MRLDRTLILLAARTLRLPVTLATGLGLAIVAAWAGQALLIARVLAGALRGEPASRLLPLFAGFTAVAVARASLLWLRETVAAWAGAVIKERLRTRLVSHLLALGPSHTLATRTGTLQSVLVNGVEGLEGYYARYLPQVLVCLLGSGGILVLISLLDPWVASTVGIFLIAVPVVPRFWDGRLRVRSAEHWRAFRELKSDYLDGMQGMTTLKTLGATGRYQEMLADRAWALFRSTMRQLATSLAGTGLTNLLIAVGTITTVLVGVARYQAGGLDPVGLVTVLLLAGECFRPCADLATTWHLAYVGFSAAGGIRDLLRAEPLPEPATSPRPAPSVPPPAAAAASSLELREVGYTYPGASRPVLDGCQLRIEAGERICLLGESGAGKSTILNLVCRLMDPDTGAILIDGVDLRSIPSDQLRSRIALVGQEPYLFTGTVADNLRLGRPDATEAQVRQAAAAANAAGFIEALPDGYHSRVDERGLSLSGGQRQRLAIARALLRDPRLLLLDEATSNLDRRNEVAIHDALERLMAGRTTLLVTHRLGSARRADRILLLRDGRIVEAGAHDDLVSAGGDYARLLTLAGDR